MVTEGCGDSDGRAGSGSGSGGGFVVCGDDDDSGCVVVMGEGGDSQWSLVT